MKTAQILSHENLPPAERAGEGEVGGCTHRVQTAWLLLSLAVEKAFVGTGWAISLILHESVQKTAFWPCGASISDNDDTFFSVSRVIG